MSQDTTADDTDESGLNRRGFVGALSAVAGGAALTTLSGSATAAQNNVFMRNAYIGDSNNRGSQIGTRGWMYFETDSGDIYWHDGTGWNNLGVGGSGTTQVATGTVTASGGSEPAVNTTLQGVSATQTQDYWLTAYVDADPSFNADYAFNFDYSHKWDDTNGEIDVDLVVTWDTDPGAGNDVTLRWEVLA